MGVIIGKFRDYLENFKEIKIKSTNLPSNATIEWNDYPCGIENCQNLFVSESFGVSFKMNIHLFMWDFLYSKLEVTKVVSLENGYRIVFSSFLQFGRKGRELENISINKKAVRRKELLVEFPERSSSIDYPAHVSRGMVEFSLILTELRTFIYVLLSIPHFFFGGEGLHPSPPKKGGILQIGLRFQGRRFFLVEETPVDKGSKYAFTLLLLLQVDSFS